jgi:pimeloyl-ACP methyl ester carboxylesterase
VAVFEHDGARIHYAEHGSGFPVLALAPGGMRSAASFWERMPWDPVAELAGSHRVIVMDQRNAGGSTAPVTGRESWATYTADQLALLDHLGVERFAVVGMCIGGPFILGLLQAASERVARTVVLQTIGRDDNREAFHEMFDAWAGELAPDHPEADPQAWAAYRATMYGGDEVLFSVPEAFLPTIAAPMLVLAGGDLHHPASASRLLAGAVPGATFVERWKDPSDLPATRATIAEFLAPIRP